MPLISAVFHNRLKRGMRLQADPTVIYGIENFNGNLTKKDLLEPTPYNTYRIAGLPPGPISRITSYNVCYTKLLRYCPANSLQAGREARKSPE